jgi:radical SAM superfamily enzyme YgiQ (UPF0313 family)
MSRVLLCNPPAPRPTMRDYYCSSTSKAGYAWQPIDLLVQAAWLKDAHLLIWRDYAVTPADEASALRQIADDRPEVIVGLVGAAAPHDFAFWEQARQRTGARLFLSGDLVRFDAADTLARFDFVDGVFLDFTRPGLRDHLTGLDFHDGLALRGDAVEHVRPGPFAYPLPPHELVWALPYRHPFLPRRFATVMTDHGCVHRCAYCNSGRVGYRVRDEQNLAGELAWLADHGVRALFIKDMTFNADAARTMRVLSLMRAICPWTFVAYLRPDRVDDELARALKATGCAMAMVGVESASDEIVGKLRPGVSANEIERGVRSLHRAGAPVGGHFLLGLPGESEADIRRTIDLARRLPLAYASFNLAAPRPGTPLFQPGEGVADGSLSQTRLLADRLDRTTLLRLRTEAARKFYLRPGYLLRRLASAVGNGTLFRELRHGRALMR